MKKLKSYFSISNIILLVVVGFFLYQQVPSFLNNSKNEGTEIQSRQYQILSNSKNDTLIFPGSKRSVVIFWATWCAPCKLEMKRLATSIKDGKMPASSIIAINPFEDKDVVQFFLRKNNHPFIFIDAPDIANELNVKITPTTLFLDTNKIISMKSGISYLGIFNAENFLAH